MQTPTVNSYNANTMSSQNIDSITRIVINANIKTTKSNVLNKNMQTTLGSAETTNLTKGLLDPIRRDKKQCRRLKKIR